jgi:cobalamin synthase
MADAWKFLVSDVTVPRGLHPFLTFAVFLVVFSPFGLWSAEPGRYLMGVPAAVAVAVVAFLAGPALFGLSAAPLVNWLAAALAVLTGWWAGRLVRGPRNGSRGDTLGAEQKGPSK